MLHQTLSKGWCRDGSGTTPSADPCATWRTCWSRSIAHHSSRKFGTHARWLDRRRNLATMITWEKEQPEV
jgi:hypothetical protein